ncbi:MAG: DHHA1 domain-containing protein [Desulfovibrio sp.]|nr:DHHA1 domain-containing protein [Desulfovibrio sp.]
MSIHDYEKKADQISMPTATLITCHSNADFDALAAMCAAALIYGPCDVLFPGTQEANLQTFYQELKERPGAAPGCTFLDDRVPDFSKYGRLVAVDTRRRSRLRHVWPLLDNPGTRIEVWDHHPETSDDVHAHVCHAEICGAVTTLLIEEIQKRNIAVSRETATVLGLGIYSDTGSFSFSSVTQRDFAAAGWLLGRGMDINIISEKTAFSMTKEHIRALNALLESAQTYHINGADVVLAEATLDSYLDDFAFLAHKMMEMEKFDILFAIGRMDDRIQIVARSRSHAVNVGAVCSAFGGGGHAYAASASVRDKTLSEVRDGILTQLYLQEEGEKTARDYMSQPAIGIEEGHTIAEADELMLHFGLKTMPVFAPMTRRCTGLIDSQITQKAISHGLAGAPLTDYMRRNLKTLPVTATLRDITTVIVGARQRLVPIVSGDSSVVGVVSRTDLINIFAQEPGRMNPTDRAPKSRNMGRTMRDRLPKDVLDILEKAGALGRSRQTPVYVVGGFVRDLLLKTPNHDIDLVVEGDGIGFARAFAGVLGGRVRVHKKFLTSVVIFPGADGREERVDVATARLEYYESPAALPTVEHSSIKMDLYRRDFTINALAIRLDCEPMGEIVDFFGGQKDIRDRVIRVLHTLSFVEDPTRCLRAVRFEQRYHFRIGPATEKLIKNDVSLKLLDKLSPARLFNEFEHICAEETAILCIRRLHELGILQAIHPQISINPDKKEMLIRTAKVMAWYRLLYIDEEMRPWLVYFLVLCSSLTYAVTLEVFRRLGIPPALKNEVLGCREKARSLRSSLKRLTANPGFKVSALCAMLRPLPVEFVLYLMADMEVPETRRALSRYITVWRTEKPGADGSDLKKLGLAPGPAYGVILQRLLEAKLDGTAASPEEQLALARQLAAQAMDGRLEIPADRMPKSLRRTEECDKKPL